MIYIACDIDGVLANIDHRLHFQQEKDYDNFYSTEQMLLDEDEYGGWKLLHTLMNYTEEPSNVAFITSRPFRTRPQTLLWMEEANTQEFYFPNTSSFYFREDGDHRPSYEVKLELFSKWMRDIDPEDDDTIIFIDDDPRNCAMIESRFDNIICLTYGTKRMERQ